MILQPNTRAKSTDFFLPTTAAVRDTALAFSAANWVHVGSRGTIYKQAVVGKQRSRGLTSNLCECRRAGGAVAARTHTQNKPGLRVLAPDGCLTEELGGPAWEI